MTRHKNFIRTRFVLTCDVALNESVMPQFEFRSVR